MRVQSLLMLLTQMLLLSACAVSQKPVFDPEFASVRPVQSQPLPVADGTIYQAGYGLALFEDKKARKVGDLITVVLQETTSASKKASTSTSKTSEIDLPAPTLFGRGVTRNGTSILEGNISTSRDFTGEGDSSQSNTLYGTITVTVSEVLPNGNLAIRGEKLLTLNQGVEHIRLSGLVRAQDIAPDNSVKSSQIANAKIIYGGDGVIAETNTKGWLQRFFDSNWWPF